MEEDECNRKAADAASLDPEDRYPPRPRISLAASLAVVLLLSALTWALVLALV
jgi:hypothetical protein